MRASWEYFASWPQTAKDFAEMSRTKLTMPVLSIGGDKSLGEAPLAAQMKLVATNVKVVIKELGPLDTRGATEQTTDALVNFLHQLPFQAQRIFSDVVQQSAALECPPARRPPRKQGGQHITENPERRKTEDEQEFADFSVGRRCITGIGPITRSNAHDAGGNQRHYAR